MSNRDLSMEVSEESGDGGLREVSDDVALATVGVLIGLENQHMFLDQMSQILLLQTNLHPQRF